MKTKAYRNGTFRCRTYMKPAGNGFEVGFFYGPKLAFMGNFVNSAEANRWYAMMNREIRTFTARYKVGPKTPKAWFGTFLSSHLYQRYYAFLNTAFTTYRRDFGRAVTKQTRTYRRMTRNWAPKERKPFLRAA